MGEIINEVEVPSHLVDKMEEYREILVEKVSENDDVLMEKFLGGEEITNDEIKAAIRKQTINNEIYPVLCGTALQNKGVQLVLNAVVDYLPSPVDIGVVKGTDVDSGEEIERKLTEDEKFSGLVFKVATDPFVGKLSFIRVYSGVLKSGSYVYNPATDSKKELDDCTNANSREEI